MSERLSEKLLSLCVECGPNVRVDEDGCCCMCGGTAMGTWLDESQGIETLAVKSEIAKLRARLAAVMPTSDDADALRWLAEETRYDLDHNGPVMSATFRAHNERALSVLDKLLDSATPRSK